MTFRQIVLSRIAALSLLGLAFGSVAHAQEATTAPQPPAAGARGQRGGQRGGAMNPNAIADAFKAATPTADQTAKFTPLEEKFKADAMTAKGKARTELMTKYAADVKALLTPDQQKAFDAAMTQGRGGQRGLMGQLGTLMLTDDQKTKIEPIVTAAQSDLMKLNQDQTLDRKTKNEKMMGLITNLKAQVRPLLTPEQQTKLDAMKFNAGGARGGRRNPGAGGAAPVAPGV